MSNVKLAIRVRPFTERELKSEKDRVPVVSVVDDHTVTITNIKVSVSGAGDSRERVRRYSADYTFDSACQSSDPRYASQEKVFETIGREVVSSVSRGMSACVLAYGQSATGKTHTMMGTEGQPGLVPRLCRAFAENQMEVTVSFLEIYNEKVHDLLAGEPLACQSLPRRLGNTRKDLRVREHPERGPYVQNLRRVAVKDLDTLLGLVEEGTRRRRTAPTRRNPTSSRSHALLELATASATLHLADLAGSEKASWEGCGGGRQKEGANINKSLVALSNVISALVSGGHRGRFVPYRDSALTWLLKDCFTGGACAFIIATVSPSVACYGESASTLRWAERARQLRTPKVLSCGPHTATRAALQAQLNQLMAELARNYIHYNIQTGKIEYEENHWALRQNDKDLSLRGDSSTDANIGNILNMFNANTEQHSQNFGSTTSSVASGSSDVLNTMDKNLNIKEEITREVDRLLAPALERTKSGSDFEAIAPLRNKRRQYKSQEILPIDKSLQVSRSTEQPTPSQSQEDISGIPLKDQSKPHVPILYDNQRAEIVASVTERLYSKLKKKEEAVVSRVENVVDKKIMEPLSELKICTNARQRLMEMNQKAMRHKGRRIGIPAFTQTRHTVTRVRDQAIDVQSDLEAYSLAKNRSYILQRDVATETVKMTPRCKEAAAGPISSSLIYDDRGTSTETKQVVHRNSFMMTDIIEKCDRCSQTPIIPPPRRRRKPLKQVSCNDLHRCCKEDCITSSIPSVISINISQSYLEDSETQSSEEDKAEECENSEDTVEDRALHSKPTTVSTTPDLLTNHNNVDTIAQQVTYKSDNMDENKTPQIEENNYTQNTNFCPQVETLEFLEDSLEEVCLPRVTLGSVKVVNQDEIKDMILGRNESVYPYNIILSPPREIYTKRSVKFREDDAQSGLSVASQTSWEWNQNGKMCQSYSDTIGSDKEVFTEDSQSTKVNSSDSTDSFISKIYNSNKVDDESESKIYTPVYQRRTKKNKAKTKIYKEFLGLDSKHNSRDYNPMFIRAKENPSESTENEEDKYNFRQRRQFFEDKFRRAESGGFDLYAKKLLDSCDSLDASVNKYESYLRNYDVNKRYSRSEVSSRSPKEYLQHLVQIRRDVVRVRTECDTTDSSVEFSRK